MVDRTGKRVIEMDKLPTLPSVAIEAIRLMEGEQSGFESIADLMRNDQVLAGRVLHYANSAHVGSRRKITSISQAISLLGFNAVRSIILSVSIFDCFSGKFSNHRENLLNFWLHSIGVAVTSEILAKRLGFQTPEEAYVAGLIHDLGKLVSYIQFPVEFAKICEEIDRRGVFSIQGNIPLEIEKSVLGFSHVDSGQELAEAWRLPDPLNRVMWLHHQPVYETILPDPANLPQLVRFADVLCVTHSIGSSYFLGTSITGHEHFHFALENLMLHHHFTTADIAAIMTEVAEKVGNVGRILGFWDEDVYRRQISHANMSLGSISMNLEQSNRQLLETNQVCGATCEMVRKLKPGLELSSAARVVLDAVQKAFGVKRCLCMIRDDSRQLFVGQFYDGEEFIDIEMPVRLRDLEDYQRTGQSSDLESEAFKRLKNSTLELTRGAVLESGVIDMVAGSQFLATFFVADRGNTRSDEQILGELVADFGDHLELREGSLTGFRLNFENIAVAASNAISRLILERDLAKQAKEMAEASRKMEESQHQLFHSHRLATVGRLAAGAAHEINNPLTIISLNIQILNRLLRKTLDEEPEIAKRLRVISEQEERISKIIQDLMGYARPTQPKFCQSNISEIIAKILAVLDDRVSMKEITVVNNIAEDLPRIMVDPLQIEQVFMNLLINANHALPGGGRIVLDARPENGFVEVMVSDNGIGISRENLPKIFDPFFTTKKEGEGTGLGLAICHSIVEHNGGAMRVKSDQDVGTTFTVLLPVDRGSQLKAMKERLERVSSVAAVRKVKEQCRILVIDDERFITDMLKDILTSSGFETDAAYDGVEGIGQLRFKKYHLVLLDIRMPRKDGLEVLKFIREEYPETKVIIITGLASREEIQETVKHGAFACLKKPFLLDKVLETINAALEHVCMPLSKSGNSR